MSGFEPEYTNRGNYRCPYCKKMWKKSGYAEPHIREHHLLEAERDEAVTKADRLDRENAELKRKQQDKPKTDNKDKWWSAIQYCENCQGVYSVSCPPGWSYATGSCLNCRVAGKLHPVIKVNADRTF